MALSTQKQRKTTLWSLSPSLLSKQNFCLYLFCRQTTTPHQNTTLMEEEMELLPPGSSTPIP